MTIHSFARFVAVSAVNFARDWYSQEMLSIIVFVLGLSTVSFTIHWVKLEFNQFKQVFDSSIWTLHHNTVFVASKI